MNYSSAAPFRKEGEIMHTVAKQTEPTHAAGSNGPFRLENFACLDTMAGVITDALDSFNSVHEEIPKYRGMLSMPTSRYISREDRDHLSGMLGQLDKESAFARRVHATHVKAQKQFCQSLFEAYRTGKAEGRHEVQLHAAEEDRDSTRASARSEKLPMGNANPVSDEMKVR